MSARIPDTHAEAWSLLPWLANGRIDASDREWVEAHVQSCAECRAELAQQQRVATHMSDAGAQPTGATNDEQRSFNKLWARIEAAEAATPPLQVAAGGGSRASRTVRWLAAAVVVQAVGLGTLGFMALQSGRATDEFVTFTREDPRLADRSQAPAVRVVFAPQTSIDSINTMLAHQGLQIVDGPGTAGNFTAVLSADAVASGATAESVASVMSKDPNVTFAQPVAR